MKAHTTTFSTPKKSSNQLDNCHFNKDKYEILNLFKPAVCSGKNVSLGTSYTATDENIPSFEWSFGTSTMHHFSENLNPSLIRQSPLVADESVENLYPFPPIYASNLQETNGTLYLKSRKATLGSSSNSEKVGLVKLF